MLALFAVLVNVLFFVPVIVISINYFLRNKELTKKTVKASIAFAVGGTICLWVGLKILSVYTSVLLFDHLGQADVFWKVFGIRCGIFVAVFVLTFLLATSVSSWLFKSTFWHQQLLFLRSQPKNVVNHQESEEDSGDRYMEKLRKERRERAKEKIYLFAKIEKIARVSILALAALLYGWIASCHWETIVLWANQLPAGIADPIFKRDVSFFLFTYPFLSWLYSLVFWLCMMLLYCCAYVFLFSYFINESDYHIVEHDGIFSMGILLKISVVGYACLMMFVARYYLLIYGIVFEKSNRFFGPGYTYVNHKILAYKIAAIILLVGGAFLFSWLASMRFKRTLIGIPILFFSVALAQSFYPFYVQKRIVEPQEYDLEKPYIAHSLAMTRQAYGIDKVEEKQISAVNNLDAKSLRGNTDTLNNIRLWDYRVLKESYQQLQGIRTYYEFGDVDIDRYMVNGQYRQVMLATRELDAEKLPEQAKKSWVNLRTTYTHGYGLCLNATNEMAPGGFPRLLVQDIPVSSSVPEIKVSKPQIYYGEKTFEHVYVYTSPKAQEFDYGKGDHNEYRKYSGKGGIKLDTFMKRLAFAWKFNELNLLLSDYIDYHSRVMYNRTVKQRSSTLVPFLKYDNDSYPVVRSDGSLSYIVDYYSFSDSYPYSEPFIHDDINYIRNSVKATVDAYDGTVNFFIFDDKDPVINTWAKVFPSLFKSKEKMPADLMKHVRYPEDMLDIQSSVFSTYHMDDTRVFFGKEDAWEIAKEVYKDTPQSVEPYYAIIKLPSAKDAEFVLMRPFTPAKRDNMVGWLAGRSDGDHYGKLICYKLPKNKMIFGPMQIEAKIDQDPEMSTQLTLWKQKGSEVIRGNILVIPFADTFIYVKPIYLKAEREGSETSAIPQLTRVVLAYGDRIVWGDTFESAFERMFDGQSIASSLQSSVLTAKDQLQPYNGNLIKQASKNLSKYFELMGRGEAKAAGQALEELKECLAKLQKGERL